MFWMTGDRDIKFFTFDTQDKVEFYMGKSRSEAKICLTPEKYLFYFQGSQDYV